MLKLASIQIIYMFQVKENKYFDLKKKNALHIKKKILKSKNINLYWIPVCNLSNFYLK